MARIKKKKATFESFESLNPNDRYFRITHSMFVSKPWNHTSIYAHEVYCLMKHKFTRNDSKGTNNKDDISLTYSEINGVMNSRTFTKAIDELIEHGFIVINSFGRYSRTANIYGFSDMWKLYGTEKFKVIKRPVRTDKGVKKKPLLEIAK